MNKEEKIKTIYEKLAEKWIVESNKWSAKANLTCSVCKWNWRPNHTCSIEYYKTEVMIWRCDLLIEKWPDYFDEWILILDLWEDKDKPIENQSERCIDHIYNLTLVSWK